MAGWMPEAQRYPGPDWKVRGTNPAVAVVAHSAEGNRWGLRSEIDRADRGSAWHFSIWTDGTAEQHYPITAALWHAGDTWANGNTVALEHEGRAGEQLTEAQLRTSIEVVRWVARERGWTPAREPLSERTIHGHGEVSRVHTNCPSGRIPYDLYVEGSMAASNAYIVSPGDTLTKIATHFQIAKADLIEWNGIADPDLIRVGAVLRLSPDAPVPALGVPEPTLNRIQGAIQQAQRDHAEVRATLDFATTSLQNAVTDLAALREQAAK